MDLNWTCAANRNATNCVFGLSRSLRSAPVSALHGVRREFWGLGAPPSIPDLTTQPVTRNLTAPGEVDR